MMKHFKKLGAPLYSINEYPSLEEQERRFKDAGWLQAHARTLWELWSDDKFVGSSLRRSLDAVEPFDEWEEFALFASHYFLLRASTKQRNTNHSPGETSAAQTSPSSIFKLLPNSSAGSGQRRFGALIPDDGSCVGHHSGLGRQTRLATTDLYTHSKETSSPRLPFPPRDISARMCHTATGLNNGECLVVGGRMSPAKSLADCWLRQGGKWRQVQPLPTGRFRHSAVKVILGHDHALVYGGKAGDGTVLGDWLLWSSNGNGWKKVDCNEPSLKPRFGASLGGIDNCSGVVFGGISQDGTVLEDFWTWKLRERSDGSLFLELSDQTASLREHSPLFKYIHRFGATVNTTSWGLVIVGGIIPEQTVPFDKEIMLLDLTQVSNFLGGRPSWSPSVLAAIGLEAEFEGPRPLLTGHVSCAVGSSEVLILGGGAVCFSFGTFWTDGAWSLKAQDSPLKNEWTKVPETTLSTQTTAISHPSGFPNGDDRSEGGITTIPRVRVENSTQFQQILANRKPVIVEGSDIGPCTDLWTKEYLANSVGRDRKVSQHIQAFFMAPRVKNVLLGGGPRSPV